MIMDVVGLANAGFSLIRNVLEDRIEGGVDAALELAETLHNLPLPGNEFCQELTQRKLELFVSKYPHFETQLKAYY